MLAFHAFPEWLRGGFVGVDIFFIISGFLISSIILAGIEQGSFSFATFYARRIKRIFPALLVVLLACYAFGWFALFPDEFKQLGKHIVAGAGFVSNIVLWNEVGYFDTASETKPLLHLWSLGIEEQFYILWPVLLVLVGRRISVLKIISGLLLLSFLLNVGGIHKFPSATFYSPASRAWELWLGAMLASMSLQGRDMLGSLRRRAGRGTDSVVSLIGFGMILLALTLLTKKSAFPGWWALLPTCGAVLILAAGPQAWFNRVVLSSRLAVWIGLISYPLYLWHWPLLSYAQIIESGTPAPAIRAAALLLAFVLAWLTYRLLEKPLRFGLKWNGKVGALSATMLLLAAAGYYTEWREGLPLRASIIESAAHTKALITVEDRANAAACKQRYGFETLWEYCQLAKIDQAPTVILIGDSHAYHLLAGLSKYYGEQGENLLMLGTNIPFVGFATGDKYQEATPRMLEIALKTESVHTVVISTIAKLNDDAMVDGLRLTLKRFREAGKTVILAFDIPRIDFDPRSCIKRAGIPSSQTRTSCEMPRATYESANTVHFANLKQVLSEFPGLQTFDPVPYLCSQSTCRAMQDGKLLYRDNNHLTYDGDLMIGAHFGAEQQAKRAQVTAK